MENFQDTLSELDAMLKQVRPFGPDYCVLLGARTGLADLVRHLGEDVAVRMPTG